MGEPVDLTIIILAFNEEKHIERCIRSVSGVAKEIIVVDSFSTDDTVKIAEGLGARVYSHKFINYSKQFAWALGLDIGTEWAMRLDADEIVEDALAEEIQRKLPGLAADVTGIDVVCRYKFKDRWIRFGGRYPIFLTRIWRRGCAMIEDRWMDEHIVLLRGRHERFTSYFVDHNLNDLTFFIRKHNSYATREAAQSILERLYPDKARDVATRSGMESHARFKRWAKVNIYDRAPLLVAPFLYFFMRYFILGGFLDGASGLKYHLFQGLWYRFLVAAKVMEFQRALAGIPTAEGQLAKLVELTGLPLSIQPNANGG
jgi:glycosyltransferase involved in cell wall biosynthesis